MMIERTVLTTYRDCDIELCCNDIQDISSVLQRLVKTDTLETTEETRDQSEFEAKQDENNNEKEQASSDDFDQEENTDNGVPNTEQ